MALEDIVQVTISKQTKSVAVANFGVPGILTHHSVFPEDYRIYTKASDMITDGFTAKQGAYRIAAALFSQNPSVNRVIVGKRASSAVAMTHTLIPTAKNSTKYTVTINGVAFEYTSDATATVAEITAGLVSAINLGSEPVTATDNTTDIDLTADVAADTYRLQVAPFDLWVVNEDTADAGIATDIAAFQVANDDWYCLLIDKHSDPEISAAAATVETLRKFFYAASMDSDIHGSGSSDIASTLQSANYTRTELVFHSDANNGTDGAVAGQVLPLDPGSYTEKFKTLAGQLTDTLTATQINNIDGKSANHYTSVAGISIYQEGVTPSGEFGDTVRFIDWDTARRQERIYSVLVNNKKIPFTDSGVGVIEAELHAQNSEGISVGGIASDPAPTVTVPLVKDVSTQNRANRILPDLEYAYNLAGAVHFVQVQGTVSV